MRNFVSDLLVLGRRAPYAKACATTAPNHGLLNDFNKICTCGPRSMMEAAGISVIGLGGIATARNAIEFIVAGAISIQVRTANFVDLLPQPFASWKE
ncbi:MAG: hypothetical protein J6I32_04530 [Bacteroidaceae bacterium]|nr:hypothetical protein [Bacteroidaceae bacterium]